MGYRTVLTICPYCGCGCGMYLEVLDGRLVGVIPCKTHPISQGKLCIKGWSAHEFVHHEGRLRTPLIREGAKGDRGGFREASWDEVLNLIMERLGCIREESGPDSIAFLSSAKCTNEENFLMMKFARAVIGTNNVDHCARLCHASTVVGLARAFGSGAMTNSIDELEDADCILITGSNTTEQHPLIASRILRAKEKGAKLILVDPRRIQLAEFADLHLRQRPGTDVAWLNGMMNVILSEGLWDEEFVRQRCENFEAFRKVAEKYTPELVEEITGIPAQDLREAARIYAQADRASIVYSMGITQHTTGTDNVLCIANLAMLTGNVGKRSTGVNPLRGQNNVQGACDMGTLPNVYSGYQSVADEVCNRKFSEAWGYQLPSHPGLTVVEMINATLIGEVRAMFIMGENPMLSDPDINHVREALEKLDFLVVQDIFLTETASFADVILPGASFAEKDGTFTGTDRRVQRVRKAVNPPGEARPDWEIICELARRFGGDGFDYSSPEEVFDEIAELTPIYHGMSYTRLEVNGLQWPCRTPEDPGTEYLHRGEFARGRGLFSPVKFKPPAELPDEEYPFILTTGRIMFHFHTGTMTRVSPTLHQEVKEGYVEVNPEDAIDLGIKDEEQVKVCSRRGEMTIKVRVTDGIDKGVVFMPFHFVESAANVLTNPALDPVAKIPELKVCAVRIEKMG